MRQKVNLLIIALALFSSCSQPDDKESQLQAFLEKEGEKAADYNYIHVVSENGCPGCNLAYYNYTVKTLGKNGHLTILAAQGTLFDISETMNHNDGIIKISGIERREPLFDSSRVFIIRKGMIDSVIAFKASTLVEQINWLNEITEISEGDKN